MKCLKYHGDDMYLNFSFSHSLSSEYTGLLHTKYIETRTEQLKWIKEMQSINNKIWEYTRLKISVIQCITGEEVVDSHRIPKKDREGGDAHVDKNKQLFIKQVRS